MSYGPFPPGHYQPNPPRKSSAGKKAAIGCLSIIGALTLMGGCAAILAPEGGEGKDSDAPTAHPAAAPAKKEKKKEAKPPAPKKPKADPNKNKVVFKVWGKALSGVDITYGSDSDNLDGKGLPFKETMDLNQDAMYYNVYAQLNGGGEIWCSVTINGKTQKGHARGDYNICDAQLSASLFGGFN